MSRFEYQEMLDCFEEGLVEDTYTVVTSFDESSYKNNFTNEESALKYFEEEVTVWFTGRCDPKLIGSINSVCLYKNDSLMKWWE